jgi:hypothetical protein
MLLPIKTIALSLNYSERGTRKLLFRLNIPLQRNGKRWYFQTSCQHPFALSIRMQKLQPDLKVFYTIKDLSKLQEFRKDPKTVRNLLRENDISTIGNRKKYVYLWDLRKFAEQLGKNYDI